MTFIHYKQLDSIRCRQPQLNVAHLSPQTHLLLIVINSKCLCYWWQ